MKFVETFIKPLHTTQSMNTTQRKKIIEKLGKEHDEICARNNGILSGGSPDDNRIRDIRNEIKELIIDKRFNFHMRNSDESSYTSYTVRKGFEDIASEWEIQ